MISGMFLALCFHVTGVRAWQRGYFQSSLFANFEIKKWWHLRQQKRFPWDLSATQQCWAQNVWKEALVLKEKQVLKRYWAEKAEGEEAEEGLSGGGSVSSFRALKRRDGEKEKKKNPPATVQQLTWGRQGVTGWPIVHFLTQGDTRRNCPSRRSNVRLTRGSRQEGLKPAALFMLTKRIFWLYRQVVEKSSPLLFFCCWWLSWWLTI